jgi:RNA polymerase sigma-70 factor (ECF subfamily)
VTEASHDRSTAEDVAFALRVRQGDHDAFRSLYERYGGAVLGLAQSVVHDRAAAEDITHDVFLGFWRNPYGFEPSRGQFVAWILRVTRNRAIDVIRKRRDMTFGSSRSSEDGEAIDPAQWIADPDPGPESEAVTHTLADDVRAALRTLPDDHRQLLELAYFGGLTQREIAERLHRPLGTVKTQMRTSLMRLSKLGSIQSLATSAEPDKLVEERRGEPGSWSLTSVNPADVTGPESS